MVCVAFSSILVRLADAPSMSIAFWRNALAAAILLPIALAKHGDELRSLSRRDWGTAVLAGALLALHFALWIPSLSYTTVAASTVLVTTMPVWVAVIGRAMGETVSRRTVLGIALTKHRGEFRSLSRREWGTAVLAGALLALHFALWIPSLSFTTVAASTVLVTTMPVWVALI